MEARSRGLTSSSTGCVGDTYGGPGTSFRGFWISRLNCVLYSWSRATSFAGCVYDTLERVLCTKVACYLHVVAEDAFDLDQPTFARAIPFVFCTFHRPWSTFSAGPAPGTALFCCPHPRSRPWTCRASFVMLPRSGKPCCRYVSLLIGQWRKSRVVKRGNGQFDWLLDEPSKITLMGGDRGVGLRSRTANCASRENADDKCLCGCRELVQL